jgi:hypothetical protein
VPLQGSFQSTVNAPLNRSVLRIGGWGFGERPAERASEIPNLASDGFATAAMAARMPGSVPLPTVTSTVANFPAGVPAAFVRSNLARLALEDVSGT